MELTRERLKCFKRFFLDVDVRRKVNIEFANFSDGREGFDDLDSLNDRGQMDPKAWWLVHGINAPILQKIALKLLAQPCSSSCCERNWSTYSFIHSLKRNKMTPHRAEDLVFVHSNLRLLSRNTPQYHQEETKMWDVAGDDFGSLDDCDLKLLIHHLAFTTKKKAFYIGSNGLSTSVMTRSDNTVSLNTDIGWRTVFEGRPFYIGSKVETNVE
ncbi:hypothetical protein D0Y65_041950 [Glycine soja]|uniref:HAT C-terminal dimerisation domain-containing protein n=1 Tax=Glycine soja TaxID=3848 RepID=A0A445GXW8_GLYSO|nr:hypothetical protein D0Y65_041950 [Glycine soja]